MDIPRSITQAAQKILAERLGTRTACITTTRSAKIAETGQTVFLFGGIAVGQYNDKPAQLILDSEARPIEAASLPLDTAMELLFPFVPAVPTKVADPLKVTIDPPRNDLRLGECDSFTETVTVTIPKSAAVGKADVYFLADTTGSMESVIAAVKAGAVSILVPSPQEWTCKSAWATTGTSPSMPMRFYTNKA